MYFRISKDRSDNKSAREDSAIAGNPGQVSFGDANLTP